MGRALVAYADEARREGASVAVLRAEPEGDPVEELALGSRQREIVEVLRPVETIAVSSSRWVRASRRPSCSDWAANAASSMSKHARPSAFIRL